MLFATLIALRFRAPEMERPFRIPTKYVRHSLSLLRPVFLSLPLFYGTKMMLKLFCVIIHNQCKIVVEDLHNTERHLSLSPLSSLHPSIPLSLTHSLTFLLRLVSLLFPSPFSLLAVLTCGKRSGKLKWLVSVCCCLVLLIIGPCSCWRGANSAENADIKPCCKLPVFVASSVWNVRPKKM